MIEIRNELSLELGQYLQASKQVMTTAESCTGGGLSMAITDIAGSSAWFDRAFVTYSNEAKMEMLGVNESTLMTHGAVSEAVVEEMAAGALTHSNATIAVSISGIAGPGGGSKEKPVGTVCFGFSDQSGWCKISTQLFSGNRSEVREKAIVYSLRVLIEYLQSGSKFSTL
ncbi:conserved hypothetical protein [Vibrio tapetis subsp. tapetis]|uniref:CinA C-terminal domain-containing protein n=1 Tax=Vibrio tapetis subsp. tapetis TaxID=1671868 RepID=A0A2N8Z891_9VIBR|nr:nicotinamide-nucleotide amidase [Vibrio tapetis]SON48073.1 conserved hypothetical protein [Vibrio tapetis subsp. tapetis]